MTGLAREIISDTDLVTTTTDVYGDSPARNTRSRKSIAPAAAAAPLLSSATGNSSSKKRARDDVESGADTSGARRDARKPATPTAEKLPVRKQKRISLKGEREHLTAKVNTASGKATPTTSAKKSRAKARIQIDGAEVTLEPWHMSSNPSSGTGLKIPSKIDSPDLVRTSLPEWTNSSTNNRNPVVSKKRRSLDVSDEDEDPSPEQPSKRARARISALSPLRVESTPTTMLSPNPTNSPQVEPRLEAQSRHISTPAPPPTTNMRLIPPIRKETSLSRRELKNVVRYLNVVSYPPPPEVSTDEIAVQLVLQGIKVRDYASRPGPSTAEMTVLPPLLKIAPEVTAVPQSLARDGWRVVSRTALAVATNKKPEDMDELDKHSAEYEQKKGRDSTSVDGRTYLARPLTRVEVAIRYGFPAAERHGREWDWVSTSRSLEAQPAGPVGHFHAPRYTSTWPARLCEAARKLEINGAGADEKDVYDAIALERIRLTAHLRNTEPPGEAARQAVEEAYLSRQEAANYNTAHGRWATLAAKERSGRTLIRQATEASVPTDFESLLADVDRLSEPASMPWPLIPLARISSPNRELFSGTSDGIRLPSPSNCRVQ